MDMDVVRLLFLTFVKRIQFPIKKKKFIKFRNFIFDVLWSVSSVGRPTKILLPYIHKPTLYDEFN